MVLAFCSDVDTCRPLGSYTEMSLSDLNEEYHSSDQNEELPVFPGVTFYQRDADGSRPCPTFDSTVPTLESLGVDRAAPRYAMKLPWDGPLVVVPYTTRQETFGFRSCERKALYEKSLAPYGKLYVNLYCDENGMYTQTNRDNCNIPGLCGDAFVCAHFEPYSSSTTRYFPDEMFEDVPAEEMPWWACFDFNTHYGLPMPERGPGLKTVLVELEFKYHYYFSCFKRVSDIFLLGVCQKARQRGAAVLRSFQRDVLALKQTFDHPESELVHTVRTRFAPLDGQDEVICKTVSALKAYCGAVAECYHDAVQEHGLATDGLFFTLGAAEEAEMRRVVRAHPRSTMNEVALTNMYVWERLFADYNLHLLKLLASRAMAPRGHGSLWHTSRQSLFEWMAAHPGHGRRVDVHIGDHWFLTDADPVNTLEDPFVGAVWVAQTVYTHHVEQTRKFFSASQFRHWRRDAENVVMELGGSQLDSARAYRASLMDLYNSTVRSQRVRTPKVDELEMSAHTTSLLTGAPDLAPMKWSVLGGLKVVDERAAHRAAVEANEAAGRAENAALELKRKMQANQERARRAALPEPAFTQRREPQRSQRSCKKAVREERRVTNREAATAAALEHGVHTLDGQREMRTERFDDKQAWEHADKLARQARVRADGLKKLAADMGAAREAATHVVPAAPTVCAAVAVALQVCCKGR